MGKRNKQKNKSKYIDKNSLKWDSLIELRTITLKQISDFINAIKIVNRVKLEQIYDLNKDKIMAIIEEKEKELGEQFNDDVKKQIINECLVMSKEDTLILTGAVNLINEISDKINIVTKNHIKNNVEDTLNVPNDQLEFLRNKVTEKDIEVFVTCYGKYTEIYNDLCNIGSKVMVELSAIIGDETEVGKKLLEISKNLTNLNFSKEDIKGE